MMRYIPENTQIQAVNAAKSSICNILSEGMVNMGVPPGMEARFVQLVWLLQHCHQKMRTHMWCSSWMSQKEVGSLEQQSYSKAPHQSRELCRSRSQDPESCAHQEGLDQVRKAATKDKLKFKLVVKKSNPPTTPATPPTKDASFRKNNWDKRTKKRQLTAHD